jgi:hypothetical protein
MSSTVYLSSNINGFLYGNVSHNRICSILYKSYYLDFGEYYNINFYNLNTISYIQGKSKGVMKVGRFIRKILDMNSINYTDIDIENFVNLYKSHFDKTTEFSIISGEDIKGAYKHINYADYHQGSITKSCMVNKEDSIFNIYSDNPETIKMVITKNSSGKITSRALLWKTEGGYYLDRIYYSQDWLPLKVIDWCESEFSNISFYSRGETPTSPIKLEKWKYPKFPYLDTFKWLNWTSGTILPHYLNNSDDSDLLIKLDVTWGGYNILTLDDDWVYLPQMNEFLKRNRTKFKKTKNGYIRVPNTLYKIEKIWSKINNRFSKLGLDILKIYGIKSQKNLKRILNGILIYK